MLHRLALLGLLVSTIAYARSIPDKLVVLTFDDSAKSHFTVVRPILKKHKFGATFFVTEGFDFRSNKTDYMTWREIAQLHQDGFEIGNHTRDHMSITDDRVGELLEQLEGIEEKCKANGIPRPTSFAWPGNAISPKAFPILRQRGMVFARRGGAPEYPYDAGRGFAYEPGLDHPFLIPSAGDARPDWQLDDFIRAVEQARRGTISVLQFHGVPDTAHSWVNTSRQNFEAFMNYLAVHKYQVVSLRELSKYVDPSIVPTNYQEVIRDRKTSIKLKRPRENFREPVDEEDLQYWLQNMLTHRFDRFEMASATGLTPGEIGAALKKLALRDDANSLVSKTSVTVLPYPGGRHPRKGFLDGAMRPQRETKVSVFAPGDSGGYVVADIPEAIWWNQAGKRELLYLAHTHIPTVWEKEEIALEPLEWKRHAGNHLSFERSLPNRIRFGASVVPQKAGVVMELWIRNGTDAPIRGLAVQNCVMLKAAPDFAECTAENRFYAAPYAACRSKDGRRWVITAWQHCSRVWGNDDCPCLHSDPKFPDCMPGQTQRLRGWISFFEGDDIEREFERLDTVGWRDEGDMPK